MPMENTKNREHILQLNNKSQRERMHKSIKLGSINGNNTNAKSLRKKSMITPDSKATLANT